MFLPNMNHKTICDIDLNSFDLPLYKSWIDSKAINTKNYKDVYTGAFWATEVYDEGNSGFLLEFPFVVCYKPDCVFNDHAIAIMRSVKPCLEWLLSTHYKDSMLMRGEMAIMLPHVKLHIHSDNGLHHKYSSRIHIPIITNDGCQNIWEDETFHMEPGKIYEIDNIKRHYAENTGDEPRMHFIFDIISKENFENLLGDDNPYVEKAKQNIIARSHCMSLDRIP